MISRTGVYGIALQGEKLLVVRQYKGPYKGRWELPGGGIDAGETIEGALRREFLEEVGMRFQVMKIFGNLTAVNEGGDFHQVGLIYRVEGVDSVSGDVEMEYAWMDRKELEKGEISSFVRQVLGMMGKVEVFEERPERFKGGVEVVSVYVERGEKALFLLNGKGDSEAGKWGVPAGKLEKGEALAQGAARELFEETGIAVEAGALEALGALYIRKPGFEYVYHLFALRVEGDVSVKLSGEHEAYRWVSRDEIRSLPLMDGANEAYEFLERVR